MTSDTAHLSRRERQIMEIVYERGRATAAEVRAHMPDPPSYSAVRAQLRILEDKGHLRHEQDESQGNAGQDFPMHNATTKAAVNAIMGGGRGL